LFSFVCHVLDSPQAAQRSFSAVAGGYEIALAYRSDAYRTIYAVKPDEDVWVIHAFQKKSTKGIKTPKREVDLIRSRISRLKEQLR